MALSTSMIIHSELASDAVGDHLLNCSDVDVGCSVGWDLELSPVISMSESEYESEPELNSA